MAIHIYHTTDDIPKYNSDHSMWAVAESDELKTLAIMQIFGELSVDVAYMTDEQCRTVLSRIQAYYNTTKVRDRVEAVKNPAEDVPED